MKLVFFGSGWYTIPVIERLISHGLDLVVTTEKNPESKFLKFCEEKKIQTLKVSQSSDLTNHKSQITNHDLVVLASFGAIIPEEIIKSFKHGILNIHPSLLPKYKGPSPIQYQLLNGEKTVGVSVIKLDNQVDHGPILSQKPYNLKGEETAEDLLNILFKQGAEMVEELVSKLEKGEELTKTPQDHSKETWSHKITKQDGHLDVSNIPHTKYNIQNMIRAFYPWPGVWFVCHPELVAESSKLSGKIIKLLPENRIQVEGKKPMSYEDFINGFGKEGKSLLEKLGLKD